LVTKRTENLTQPQMAPRIERQTRKDFPEGIPSYGTDALRFTFCALATTGRDVRFDLHRIEGYRNFCNKLWNAARFVLMNCKDCAAADRSGEVTLGLADRWIRSRAHDLLVASQRAIDTYRFDLYAAAVYDFVWHEYCDWYLELTKPLLWNEQADPALLRGTRRTLLEVLDLLLRAAHPIMPFITEAIWREMAPLAGISGATIMVQAFPRADDLPTDPEADAAITWLKGVVLGVRNIRGEAGIKPGQTVDRAVAGRQPSATASWRLRPKTCSSASPRSVRCAGWTMGEEAPPNALALVGEMRVMVPLAGLIDKDAERTRLTKDIDRKANEVARLSGKLGNASFVDKAPAAVVDKERQKLADAETALTTLRSQLAAIERL
jgi:valyl-tRNA synthetase